MKNRLSSANRQVIEQLYKIVTLDTMSVAVVVFDTHYTILYLNKAAEKLYGWNAEDIVGQNEQKIMKTRLLDTTTEEYRRALRTKHTWTGELIQQRKNGQRFFVSSTISTIKNERGATLGYVAMNYEITEYKHTEYNLRFLAASAKAMSSTLDYQTTLHRVAQLAVPRIADWCSIELINDKGELEQVAITHRDPKKVKWAIELRKKNQPNLSDENNGVVKVLKSGKPEFLPYIPDEMLIRVAQSPRELALLRKLGMSSVIIVPITSSDHKPIGAITLIATESQRHYTKSDLQMAEKLASRASLAIQNAQLYKNAGQEINERRAAEKKARDSQHQLDLILKNVADGITMINSNGRLVYANDIAAQATGFRDAEDMLSTPYRTFVKKISQFELKDEHGNLLGFQDLPGREVLQGKQTSEKIIQFRNKKTGECRWSLIKARSTPITHGAPDYIINIITDITEQKELENRKDNFISMASHELKTPITTLKIYTDLLTRQLHEHQISTYDKPLTMMHDQINKLGALVADLLNLSKIQAGKLEFRMISFNVDRLVAHVVDQMKMSSKHEIKIFGAAKKKIYGDPERITQVLINLLTNAIKYSPESNKIHVHIQTEPKYVTIKVKDFGIGIEKKYRKKIFERFYQVSDHEKTFPGLGMGLYISQEIIRRHGGIVWVESTKGKGSTFSFTLPLGKKKPKRS